MAIRRNANSHAIHRRHFPLRLSRLGPQKHHDERRFNLLSISLLGFSHFDALDCRSACVMFLVCSREERKIN